MLVVGDGLKLRHREILVVSIPLAFGLAFIGILAAFLLHADGELQKQARARAVIERATVLSDTFNNAAHAVSNSLITGGHVLFSDSYVRSIENVPPQLTELQDALGSGAREQQLFIELQAEVDQGLKTLQKAQSLNISNPELRQLHANDLNIKINEIGRKIRDISAQLTEGARQVDLESPDKIAQSRAWLNGLLIVGVLLNTAVAIGVAMLMSKGITQRLKVLTDNSYRLAIGQSLHPPLKGSDEIADLDRVFHTMAAEIAEAVRKERAIIENAVDVICTIDGDGKLVSASPSVGAAWGYESQELVGQRYVSLVDSESADETLSALAQAKNDKLPTFTYENKIKRKDGTIVDVSWTGCWSEADKTIFCIGHDITERKRLEQLRQDFVAMITHDLRSPLSSVRLFLDMLIEGYFDSSPASVKKKAEAVEANVARLLDLINNLLELERMEAGKVQLMKSTFNISDLFSQSIDSVQLLAEQKRITLSSEYPEMLLFADDEKLVRVVINLLSNAIKFSPPDSCVTLSAVALADMVEVRVRDQGRGIPEGQRAKIFNRFEQVELADSRKSKGTGLGLAICEAIVSAHGGGIGVDSEEGKGSTFWFRIPAPSVEHEPTREECTAIN